MPSIGQAAARAWRDVLEVFRTHSPLALIAFVIILAIAVGGALWRVGPSGITESSTPFDILSQVLQAFLVTPYLIAVHRFIILREVTRDYWAAFREPRFQRFFGWSIALSAIWWTSIWLGSLLRAELGTIVATILAAIVPLVVSLRFIVMFPAVAVDAPGATWQNAVADSKGHAWRIFLILLVTGLPLFVADIVVLMAAVSGGILGSGPLLPRWMILGTVLGSVAEFVYLTLAVVVASRLYEWIGERVKGAA